MVGETSHATADETRNGELTAIRKLISDLGEDVDPLGEVDWENEPASFEELFGIPAPPGLPPEALLTRAERIRLSETTSAKN
ncbi:hypothetical protein ABZ896_43710 [Streptomyces sp. NPDC047072]|uniref:hypothetical protein n=1 Tax=Streptomyces sp. NPDC047072 TaxID=3154809 RepID=UPI0033D34297